MAQLTVVRKLTGRRLSTRAYEVVHASVGGERRRAVLKTSDLDDEEGVPVATLREIALLKVRVRVRAHPNVKT